MNSSYWLDFGTITILWSQPVAALQILSPDGKWRWIKHMPNALVSLSEPPLNQEEVRFSHLTYAFRHLGRS